MFEERRCSRSRRYTEWSLLSGEVYVNYLAYSQLAGGTLEYNPVWRRGPGNFTYYFGDGAAYKRGCVLRTVSNAGS